MSTPAPIEWITMVELPRQGISYADWKGYSTHEQHMILEMLEIEADYSETRS